MNLNLGRVWRSQWDCGNRRGWWNTLGIIASMIIVIEKALMAREPHCRNHSAYSPLTIRTV